MILREKFYRFIRGTGVSLFIFTLMAVPSVAAVHRDRADAVVADAIDPRLKMDSAQYSAVEPHAGPGGDSGHLPGSSLNVELVGKVTVSGIQPNRISNVGVLGNYAYLGAASQPCGKGGVYVINIADPTKPKEVGFIPTAFGSYVGEAVQLTKLDTNFFKGDVLVINNEVCKQTGSQIGGFSIFDVTNPLAPVALVQGAGDPTPSRFTDTNQIHSAFVWQEGKNAYLVAVDDEEDANVDIFDITNPRAPVQVSESGLASWPGAQNDQSDGIGIFRKSFFHDVVVKNIKGHFIMLLSYWDAGWILLNVDNPASPVFINDTDFADPDPLTGISPPEGNAHQAEWNYDDNFIIGTTEDFSPFRAAGKIDSGPFAGQSFFVTPGNGVLQIKPDQPISGSTYFVGRACSSSPLPAAPSANAIALIEQGTCFLNEKMTNTRNAGYAASIVFNSAVPDKCEVIIQRSGTEEAPFLSVSRSSAFAILGIPGYNPANCPNGSNPALPPVGTAGSTVTIGAQFDGWGDVHLFDANTLREIDTYAVPEALNPAFARGFGVLSVHKVATDTDSNLAYLSYYNAGLRVIKFGPSGIEEVGHFIAPGGNDFWGVELFRLPNDPTRQTYVAASDRDSGLWIFKYTGR